MKTHFETETCSRCHGSGKYSYCERFADICFKCGGAKVVLTSRGAAAKAYLENLCSKPASALQVGERVLVHGMTLGGTLFSYIATVTSIEVDAADPCISTSFIGPRNRYIEVTTSHPKYGENRQGVYNSDFRMYPANNEKLIAKALEYQSSLTKKGVPKKSRKTA